MAYIDPELGKPLPEQSYAEDCKLYDPGHPAGPFHNFWVSEFGSIESGAKKAVGVED